MAKSRKQSSDRHERLLGIAYGVSAARTASSDVTELSEEDVWASAPADESPEKDDSWYDTAETTSAGRSGQSWLGGGREERRLGGLSLVLEEASVHHRRFQSHRQQCYATGSVPEIVADWSRMSRDESLESLHGNGGEVDGDEGEWLPPHQYLARQYGKSMVAPSVFEGVGRTLKGRDMRRVRDAVWSQTGFFG